MTTALTRRLWQPFARLFWILAAGIVGTFRRRVKPNPIAGKIRMYALKGRDGKLLLLAGGERPQVALWDAWGKAMNHRRPGEKVVAVAVDGTDLSPAVAPSATPRTAGSRARKS